MTKINTKNIPASTPVAIWEFERWLSTSLSPSGIQVMSLEEARKIKDKDRFMCVLPEVGYSDVIFEDGKFKLYEESDYGKKKEDKKAREEERLVKRNQALLEESGLLKSLPLDKDKSCREYKQENGCSIKVDIKLERHNSTITYYTMSDLKMGPVLYIDAHYYDPALEARGYYPYSYSYIRVRLLTFAKYFNIKKLGEFVEWWFDKILHEKHHQEFGNGHYDCSITEFYKDYPVDEDMEKRNRAMKWLDKNAQKELK